MMNTTFRLAIIKPITRILDYQIIIDATLASDDGCHIQAQLCEYQDISDVTLANDDGRHIQAHK